MSSVDSSLLFYILVTIKTSNLSKFSRLCKNHYCLWTAPIKSWGSGQTLNFLGWFQCFICGMIFRFTNCRKFLFNSPPSSIFDLLGNCDICSLLPCTPNLPKCRFPSWLSLSFPSLFLHFLFCTEPESTILSKTKLQVYFEIARF